MYNSVDVTEIVRSNWIGFEQLIRQVLMIHRTVLNNDWLQLNSIIDIREISWLRRNSNGFESRNPLGIKVIVGE